MKKKSGFSLAEMLISLAIVAIVATMVFVISKKGTERAYNLFYYSGYEGLTDAFADAQERGLSLEFDNFGTGDFMDHVSRMLVVNPSTDIVKTATSITINARNGIRYVITSGHTPIDSGDGVTRHLYKIQMYVPSVRKAGGATTGVVLFYSPEMFEMLIPNIDSTQKINDTDLNLQERYDLLPFYFDDGETGVRVLGVENKDETEKVMYKARQFKSFKDVFCAKYGAASFSTISLVDCQGVPTNTTEGNERAIKLADPKKVF